MTLKQIIKNIRPLSGNWISEMVEKVAKEYTRYVLYTIQDDSDKFIEIAINEKKELTTWFNFKAWKNFGL